MSILSESLRLSRRVLLTHMADSAGDVDDLEDMLREACEVLPMDMTTYAVKVSVTAVSCTECMSEVGNTAKAFV